jgi:DNA-binding NarL/FixJ family response regulator
MLLTTITIARAIILRTATRTSSIAVCTLEPNYLAAESLRRILHRDPSLRVVGFPHTDVRSLLTLPSPVFVVDNSGLPFPLHECIRRLKTLIAGPKFIVLDRDLSTREIAEFLFFGIHGYVPFSKVERSLLLAIHSVSKGSLWFSPETLQCYVQIAGTGYKVRCISEGHEAMTLRERDVLQLLRRRFSNRAIAEMLKIRESTVKFHVSHVLGKLGARSRHDVHDVSVDFRFWENLPPPLKPKRQ